MLRQPVWNWLSTWNYTLNWKRYLISVFHKVLTPCNYLLEKLLGKKKQFPWLLFMNMCSLPLVKILPNCQTFLCRVREISLSRFLLVSALKEGCNQTNERNEKSYFWFQWNCKQSQVAVGSSMANCDIYFQLFLEIKHFCHEIVLRYGILKCGYQLL